MTTLSVKTRVVLGKKVKALRKQGILPGVLYGYKTGETPLEVGLKEFKKVFKEAGESQLISLDVSGQKAKHLVLIHDVAFDPLTEEPIHVDFYQPNLTQELEVKVPLVFEGESLAVRELGGTLVKNIHEVEVRALPQDLPHEIKVSIDSLATFQDSILIKDLVVPPGVQIMKDPGETVAMVEEPQKVEAELEKPIEEKVAEVEKVGEKKKEEAGETE